MFTQHIGLQGHTTVGLLSTIVDVVGGALAIATPRDDVGPSTEPVLRRNSLQVGDQTMAVLYLVMSCSGCQASARAIYSAVRLLQRSSFSSGRR